MNKNTCIIKTKSLSKAYVDGTSIDALIDVSLTIFSGEFVSIMGTSGSGKTTLLNMIGTLDYPTSGSVIVDGVDVSTLNGNSLADFRRSRIGFVFQLFNLVPTLTALENVTLPLFPYRRQIEFDMDLRAQGLLEKMGLGDRFHHLPGQLSGGEQQRAAIARALINHPKLILADEPTGNLDSQNGEDIMTLLRQLNQEIGITVLITTHDEAIASKTNRIVHLHDGSLVSIGE